MMLDLEKVVTDILLQTDGGIWVNTSLEEVP